jgi:hypothetical protein
VVGLIVAIAISRSPSVQQLQLSDFSSPETILPPMF